MKKKLIYLLPILFLLMQTSCKKCNLKGENVLSFDFDSYDEWLLYSEYAEEDEFYSRIEDGVLKLKTDQKFTDCQRATYYWNDDFSSIKGFEACIHINQLNLPKDVDIHFYFSLGNYEVHANIEKKKSTNTIFKIKADDSGITSNLKGALKGGIGNEFEDDNYTDNFIQIALCPQEDSENSEGEMYIEIDKIEVTIL
ncbi:MAG: hypothetical protein WDZ35_10480 [Crocinitomicaceae bacterium]